MHLDIRHLGAEKIHKKLPFVFELCKNYAGVDPTKEPIPVRPVVHYMMGGVHTNVNCETPMPGLYAIGECSCIGINGANRLGSNSLTELLVFGKRGGEAAAKYALSAGPLNKGAVEKLADAAAEGIRKKFLAKTDGKERIAALRAEMGVTMEAGCGIYRTESSLKTTYTKIAELRARFKDVTIDDRTNCYNTDLTAAIELDFMLEVAETIAGAALARTESRGAHQRTDFPKRDDAKFLKHTMVYRAGDGKPRIDYLPVVITKWPQAERVYGK